MRSTASPTRSTRWTSSGADGRGERRTATPSPGSALSARESEAPASDAAAADLGIVNPESAEPSWRARPTTAPAGKAHPAAPPGVLHRPAGRVPTKDLWVTLRPRRAVPGGRLREPASGRGRPPGYIAGPRHRRRGHRVWHTFGLDPLPAPRGLALMPVDTRLHAPAEGFFDRSAPRSMCPRVHSRPAAAVAARPGAVSCRSGVDAPGPPGPPFPDLRRRDGGGFVLVHVWPSPGTITGRG